MPIGEPDWIWVDSDPTKIPVDYPCRNHYGLKTSIPSSNYHGTGMLSRAVGPIIAVSRKAAVTIVKLAEAILGWGDHLLKQPVPLFRTFTLTNSFAEVINDVITRGIQHKAVISLSIGVLNGLDHIPVPTDNDIYAYYHAIQTAIDNGIVVVCSTGNFGNLSVSSFAFSRRVKQD